MSDIILIKNYSDYDILIKKFGNRFNDANVYTLLPKTFFNLIDKIPKLKLICDHFTATESLALYHRALELSSEICDSFPETANPVSINIARFYKYYLFEFLHEIMSFDTFVKTVIGDRKYNRIFYVKRPFPLPFSHYELILPDFISSWILKGIENDKNCIVLPVRDYKASFFIKTIKRPISEAFNRGKRWIRKYFYSIFSKEDDPFLNSPRVIALGSGWDALSAIPDAARVSQHTGLPLLFVMEWIDKHSTRIGLNWKKEYNSIDKTSLPELFRKYPVKPLNSSETKQADFSFSEFLCRLNKVPEIKKYGFVNSLVNLRHEFHQFLGLSKAINHILPNLSHSKIVLTHVLGMNERILEQLAPKYNIELYARPNGIFAHLAACEYNSTCCYCDGRISADLLKCDLNFNNIEIHARPELINAAQQWLETPLEVKHSLRNRKLKKYSIMEKLIVLLLSTGPRPRILNEFDSDRFFATWELLFNFLNKTRNIHIFVKSHIKNQYDDWIRYKAANNNINNISILKGKLEEALRLPDLVIDFGKPGSATLCALLFNQPLLLYNGLHKYIREFGNMIHTEGNKCTASTPLQLIQELNKFSITPDHYKDNLLKINQGLKEKLLSINSNTYPPSI